MGTIDAAWVKLTCKKCDVAETQTYSDHGSMWSGSWWNGLPQFERFKVKATEGGKREPEILSAKCSKCGADADQEHRYTPFG